jgi:hypothetical protein
MPGGDLSVENTPEGRVHLRRRDKLDRRKFLQLVGIGIGSTALLGLDGCEDTFVLGETKPDATNTGLTGPTTTTSTGGNLTFSTNDEVIENVRFERRVSVAGKRITFRNCEFLGPATGLSSNLVTCTNANCEDVLFERCTFRAQDISAAMGNAIMGHHYTARRCDMSHVIDGAGCAAPSDGPGPVEVTIEGCYIHDLAYLSPFPSQSDNVSHNDCIQLHSAGGHHGVRIFGNTLAGFVDPDVGDYHAPTFDASGNVLSGYGQAPFIDWYAQGVRTAFACVQHSPQGSGTTINDVVIEKNWLDGGSLSISYGSWTSAAGGSALRDNRFGRGARDGRGVLGSKPAGLIVSGNVMEDTAQPYDGGPYP